MGWRLTRLNQELRNHDRRIFATEQAGVIQIWRKADRWDAADLSSEETGLSQPTQYLGALTDSGEVHGTPVDIGIEPIMQMIRQMDGWTRGSQIQAMRKRREREEEDKKRQQRNETRSIAADLRREFAEAVNDINTSSLDVKEGWRKYGNMQS